MGPEFDAHKAETAQIYFTPASLGYDGSNSFGTFVQMALDLCRTNGGGKVWIPRGYYQLDRPLYIYSNTTLSLDEGAVISRNFTDNRAMLTNGEDGAEYGEYAGERNIIIEGGVWISHPDPVTFGSPRNLFAMAKGVNTIIRNVTFRDVISFHAIDLNGMKDVIIENCRFEGFTNAGGREYSEAIQIASMTNFITFGTHDDSPCANITIRNCYFGPSDTMGPWGTGIGNHGAVYDKFQQNIIIENCYFDGCAYAGIRTYLFNDVAIQGKNVFKNCQRGILVNNRNGDGVEFPPQSGKNLRIVGNLFEGTVQNDINIQGASNGSQYDMFENVEIADNVFFRDPSNQANTLSIRLVKNLVFRGNRINSCYRGIQTWYCSDVYILDNLFTNIAREAIITDEDDNDLPSGLTTNHRIVNNIVKGAGYSGMLLRYIKGVMVLHNYLEDTANAEDSTRSAIAFSTLIDEGIVAHNRVRMGDGFQNNYGISMSVSTSNLQLFNNDLEGKSGRISYSGTNNFDGFYIHSPNGTRYKVTVDNLGNLVVT